MSGIKIILVAAAIYAVKNLLEMALKNYKIKRNRKILTAITPKIEELKKKIKSNGYLSSSYLSELKKQYKFVFNYFYSSKNEFLDTICQKQKNDFLQFITNYNREFVKNEKIECAELFHIGKYKLDDEQQTAVITDEDNNLVIAGAGSGKTLTIMAKVNYLVKRKKVNPKDILLIAFARKAAEEMTTRIQKTGINIEAQTFHKLGLDIITNSRGQRPNVAEESFIKDFLINYFVKALQTSGNSILFQAIVEYFAYYLNIPSNLKDFSSLGAMYEHEKNCNLTTLKSLVQMSKEKNTVDEETIIQQLKDENITLEKTIRGEQVKSLQEVEIANFLFLNGVEYDYERPYPYKSDECRKEYTPDFCIYPNGKEDNENCIWLEHFGINENNKAPWLSKIEEKKYLEGIKWKRNIHKENNTILEETYSYDFQKGTLGGKLNNLLKKYNIEKKPVNYEEIYNSLFLNVSAKYFKGFIEFCSTFINLFKSSHHSIDDIANLIYSNPSLNFAFYEKRMTVFKIIIKNIIIEYEKTLKEKNIIDFSDMIIEAENIVENNSKIHNYKYVIIDEFQDISDARSKLIKTILNKTKAHLFCVGDDWQSIYRFTGSDVGIFLKFKETFGATAQMYISNTYRNSQDLINLASKFIQKNPNQIKKNLHSKKQCHLPVRFYMYSNKTQHSAIEHAIDDFIKDNSGNDLLILGRTNYDKEILLTSPLFTIKNNKLIYVKNKELNVEFLTVHKSKGTEADNVLILNFNNDTMGFPNKIVDDPLLELVLSNSDSFMYAEERRLLYVALTRTKNRVSLITDINNASEFLKDLDNPNYSIKINTENEDISPVPCPHCKTGHLVIRTGDNNQSQFLGCTNYPKCKYTINDVSILQDTKICPKCGGYLVKKIGKFGPFYGCTNHPECTYTLNIKQENDIQ